MNQSLPASPAWFAHKVDGNRHLGVLIPGAEGAAFFDLGSRDEVSLLASAQLDGAGLQLLAESGEPMGEPPIFDVPVARPSKILCLGKNFAAHAAEFDAEVPEEPLFFTKLSDTLLPHRGTVILPHWLHSRIDHEVELAVILGFEDLANSGRKYVSPEEAKHLVAGYTILNDITARQIQGDDREAHKPWLRSKSFDTFCPIGPWVVAHDDLLTANDLAIEMRLGEELRQSSRTSLMAVDIPTAISYLSKHCTLRPGDIIAMGTPEGVGPIEHGDVMTCHIEGIGELINPVRRED